MTPQISKLQELLARATADDDDHMVATGDDFVWLAAQLACWPTRVDPDCTTNDRFLRLSAAATMQSLLAEIEALRAEGWQDIATAPKGEPLLVFCPDAREPQIVIATFNDFTDMDSGETVSDWTDEWQEQDLDVEPLFWRPLPPPPKGSAQ